LPVYWKKEEEDFRIDIWKSEEDVPTLTDMAALSSVEKSRLDSFQSDHRKKEWLCARTMLRKMLPSSEENIAITYDEYGKPHLSSKNFHISISHSGEYVALIISKKYSAGIDIERIRSGKIESIAHRFLSPQEKSIMPADDPLRFYYMVWSAKETLYKIDGKRGLEFKKHIFTEPKSTEDVGEFNAWIRKNDFEKKFLVHYEFIGDLLLAYSLST
jgi:4'-phosphopantetheinyl transferase